MSITTTGVFAVATTVATTGVSTAPTVATATGLTITSLTPAFLAGASVAGAAACTVLGHALTQFPSFWRVIQDAAKNKKPSALEYCGVKDMYDQFSEQAEQYYKKSKQASASVLNGQHAETLAALAALMQNPALVGLAQETDPRTLEEVVQNAGKLPTLSDSEMKVLNDKTAMLVEQSWQDLKRRFHQHTLTQFKAACQEVGWKLKDEAANDDHAAIIAINERGQTLAAHVNREGEIATDLAGFTDGSCAQSMDAIFKALEKRGIRIERKKEQPHYLFKGGSLLAGATQAEQILLNAEKSNRQQSKRQSISKTVKKSASSRELLKKGSILYRLRNIAIS